MTFSRSPRGAARRTIRGITSAAVLAGALTLTACGGDAENGPPADPTPSATSTVNTDGGTGTTSSAPADGLAGSWLATTHGKAVVLVVNGKQAAVFTTGGTVCSGAVADAPGTAGAIRLTCTDGSTDRANGTVDSVGARTLRITWKGGLGTETYTRSEGGKLPSGLPTAGLGS
ncbi:hypothetical protein ACL02U_04670 [Streptomyces sp. MS06]|uniref:hypothetical protein n=1 Tax=Streptomyces sp. MS06 TaxID=3385974 RepID=UPI0039A2CF53